MHDKHLSREEVFTIWSALGDAVEFALDMEAEQDAGLIVDLRRAIRILSA